MNFLTKKLLINSLVLFSLAISKVKSQCCDFSSYYPCQWDYVDDSWQNAPSSLPSNAPPGFNANDGYFAWLQDQSGTMKSQGTFDVTSPSSGFNFDYYFYTEDAVNNDYLRVFFLAPGHINGIEIASITISEDRWKNYVVTCDYTNNFCCGSLSAIPCSGKIEIVGKLGTTSLQGLFGIDNICGAGEITTPTTTTPTTTTTTPTTTTTTPTTTTTTPTTTTTTPTTTTTTPTTTTPTTTTPTTTTPYTLPPPVPSSCCEFEANTCGFKISYPYWYWSANRPVSIPSHDGNFFWTDEVGAFANTSLQTFSSPYTTFSLSYYTGGGNIVISFQESGDYPLRNVDYLSYSPSTNYWRHKSIQVDDLCRNTGYPCTGYFVLQTTSARTFVVAIDDVDIDGQCHRSLPCCYFSDDLICDLNNITFGDYYWKWSGDSKPVNPPSKSPGTDYVFFETVDYIGNEIYASLKSNEVEIPWDVAFRGNFYAQTPDGVAGVQALQLNFLHSKTGVITSMDFVKDTSKRWLSYPFQCVSVHGDCCQGEDVCKGTIEFTAFVQTNGGSLLYGIDALEVDGKCTPFPGLTMISPSRNISLEIPLYPYKKSF